MKVLRFVKKYALSLTSVTSVAIVCAAVTGFLHELHRTCHPDLKFWLMILAGRLSLRLVTRLYLEAAINGSASGDVLLLNKIIEILDVFGMVS